MSDPIFKLDPKELTIDVADAKAAAEPYAEAYQAAGPYNHICIDDFLPPEILQQVREDLSTMPEAQHSYSRAQENLKSSYNPERLPTYTRNLFHTFNSRPFLMFLEKLTGINRLIPDPYYVGAGIHQVANGGHLDIHADFILHGHLHVERRLNVLIYLNEDWDESYGGSFEVWDKAMTKKEASFVPHFNRMVCFSTGSDTFHGNPEPVNHPNGEPRRLMFLFY